MLAIKKLDAKNWACWRMVELAFLGCLFLARVVPPYGTTLSVGDTGSWTEL